MFLGRLIGSVAATVALTTALSYAAPTPAPSASPSGKPQGSEVAFVSGVQKDLNSRFATAADAEKAGYFRFTNEDKTGSISYANLDWTSQDQQHPSQLWYDVKGNLLGADFSLPRKSKTEPAPQVWGVQPSRWTTFGAHVHYVVDDASGKETYGATSVAKFTNAGGNINAPKADTLAKMGLVKDASQVKHIFLFPAVWDLQVWTKENPNGAFAQMNPLVTPSANASSMGD